MHKYLLVVISTVLIVIITSCSNNNNIINPNLNLTDSKKLVQIIDFDTTKVSGYDTVYKVMYNYDNHNRLKTVSYDNYLSLDRGHHSSESFVYEFEYIGLDTNVYSKTTKFHYTTYSPYFVSDTPIVTNKKTYQYNNQGILSSIFDSVIYSSTGQVFNKSYYYNGNLVIDSSFKITNSPYHIDTSVVVTHYSKTNKNISLQIDSTNNRVFKFNCTYDTKTNPNSKFNNQSKLSSLYLLGSKFFDNGLFLQPNNLTDYSTESYNNGVLTGSNHIAFIYEYNALNLPISCQLIQNNINTWKRKFYYSN